MSRKRHVVEREVPLNKAEMQFIRRAIQRSLACVPVENEGRYILEPLVDRIVAKIDRHSYNWSAAS